ncbi:hypothetical protein [Paraliomyxa miuraensis]|uniref:hypothetical protein n=1 Tax=Paraliomyxa miuraensis TaxID=376150 RepID=UPI0022551AD9|nr:hypothetical protein [Paraliomyxa miuraensis]MCX4247272.1 hypothetical protein [Paraliomyxa miuraensis]
MHDTRPTPRWGHVSPWSSSTVLLCGLGLCGLGACRPPAPPPRIQPPAPAPREPAAAPPSILSAHLARVDDPELGGKDGILLVLDAELDAASLRPRAFVISRTSAGPVWPEQAILAPASEDDENRTVLLIGEFGEPGQEPSHVAIAGSLWSEDGRLLQGLGAPVTPSAAPPYVVALQVLPPAPQRCEGVAQTLRTYWTDELRGVEADDLSRIRVRLHGGALVSPVRFDDHETEHGEAGQDNVLDLCVDDPAPIDALSVQGGAFHDVAGHRSASLELRPSDPVARPGR